jgi:hypothetical protein
VSGLKKILLILICITVTLPRDIFHTVFHIADILHHFHHHHEEEHISFSDFIIKHNSDETTHHHDEDDHQDFPANHRHITDDFQFVSIPAHKICINISIADGEGQPDKFPLSQQIAESLFIRSIWQPPKTEFFI